MRKLIGIVAIGLGTAVGTSASATPICDFITPTDGGPRYGHAHYVCVWGVCRKAWYAGGADLYAAQTEDGSICNLASIGRAARPFYINFASIGSPPIVITAWADADTWIVTLPWSCLWRVCLLGGGVTTASYGPGLPRAHFRAWLFTMTY